MASLASEVNDKAWANRELGLAYYNQRQFSKAQEAYLESLKLVGDDPITLNNLAYLLVNDLNQVDKALTFAAKAATLLPNSPDIVDTYGWALAKSGKYADAEQQLMRAIQSSPDAASAAMPRYHLGWVYEQTKRTDDALRQYRLASETIKDQADNPLNEDLSKALLRLQRK